jgi:hypothetical protein
MATGLFLAAIAKRNSDWGLPSVLTGMFSSISIPTPIY